MRDRLVEILFFLLPPVMLLFRALTGLHTIYFTIVWLGLLALLWVGRGLNGEWTRGRVKTSYSLIFVALALFATLSTLINWRYKVALGALAQCVALVPIYWLLTQSLSGLAYRRVLTALLWGTAAASLGFLIAFSRGSPGIVLAGMAYGILRPMVLGENPNSWAIYPLIGLPIAAGLILYPTKRRWWRLWPMLSVPPLLAVALLTMSRSALLGAFVGVVFLLACHRVGRKLLLLTPLVGLAAVLALKPEMLTTLESMLRVRAGLSGRERIWSVSVDVIANNPLLGIGPGGLRDRYFFTAPFMEKGMNFMLDPPSAHNAFLNLAAELGVPALLAGLLFFIIYAYRSRLLWKKLKGRPDFAVLAIGGAIMAAGLARSLFEVDFILPHGYIHENLILITMLGLQDQLFHR
jgi:O-antigen ligase